MSPTTRRYADMQAEIGNFLNAASEADTAALASAIAAGTRITSADYDYRTAMHLAATEGHTETVRFLVSNAGADLDAVVNAEDRWCGTPLGDAVHNGHDDCAEILEAAGARAGATAHYGEDGADDDGLIVSPEAPRILFAASQNDVAYLVRDVARGEDILVADYDNRTAFHLAASNGHVDVCKYIITQAHGKPSALAPRDRFGNTPLDDAKRGNFADLVAVIEAAQPDDEPVARFG